MQVAVLVRSNASLQMSSANSVPPFLTFLHRQNAPPLALRQHVSLWFCRQAVVVEEAEEERKREAPTVCSLQDVRQECTEVSI